MSFVLEETLKEINRGCIALDSNQIKRNNQILDLVVNAIKDKMRSKDVMFDRMYSRIFYGGSFYDDLKIGQPEEYDLDLLLRLPSQAKPILETANIPGFVHIKFEAARDFINGAYGQANYRKFSNLMDDKQYLVTQEVYSWVEGILFRALNDYPRRGSAYVLENRMGTFNITVRRGGPALTLSVASGKINMDIDLVPCFEFTGKDWPKGGFRQNPVPDKPNFFIVPKQPDRQLYSPTYHPIPRYWRLSFQEQERSLMKGNKERLKPTIRLLKKLRDNQGHSSIKSYHIKTIVLLMAENQQYGSTFFNSSLSTVFLAALEKYKDTVASGQLQYYWNKRSNLFGNIHEDTLRNISNRLVVILRDLRTSTNRLQITLYFYSPVYSGTQEDSPEFVVEYVEEEPASSCVIL